MQTFVVPIILPPGSTDSAPINIGNGVAPTAPVNGDLWLTSSDMLYRVGGNTRTVVNTVRQIATDGSLTGGGDLSANRTLQLDGDDAAPGNEKYYGTDSGGNKGFFDLPAAAAIAWWGTITNATAISISAAGSATIDRFHTITGTGYTITLPAASTNSGGVVGFTVSDSVADPTYQFKLDAGAGVAIAGRTRYLTLIRGNTVLLISDGTRWIPLVTHLDTPWVVDGTLTITTPTGGVNNPSKGTTTVDRLLWRRVGDILHFAVNYRQTGAGTAGTGSYLYELPFSVDTTVYDLDTAAFGEPEDHVAFSLPFVCGRIDSGSAASEGIDMAMLYDSTHIRIGLVKADDGTSSFHDSSNKAFSSSQLAFSFAGTAKITDW